MVEANDSDSILITLFNDIDHRIDAITQAEPAWPCHQGCDLCCRQLPFLPEITRAEWALLYEGFQTLTVSVQEIVGQRLAEAAEQESHRDGFVTCPLLDREKGECLVYMYRPAACRMYGFYVTRSGNRWCNIIQAQYETGFAEGIVLGNQQSVDRAMIQNFGETRSIAVWFEECKLG
jgi:Fe-S-cluster containining protein